MGHSLRLFEFALSYTVVSSIESYVIIKDVCTFFIVPVKVVAGELVLASTNLND